MKKGEILLPVPSSVMETVAAAERRLRPNKLKVSARKSGARHLILQPGHDFMDGISIRHVISIRQKQEIPVTAN
jgi:hypothetical protein